jgi:hypothetical protein
MLYGVRRRIIIQYLFEKSLAIPDYPLGRSHGIAVAFPSFLRLPLLKCLTHGHEGVPRLGAPYAGVKQVSDEGMKADVGSGIFGLRCCIPDRTLVLERTPTWGQD